MMPTAIAVLILIVATISAILSGIAVFTNVRPEKPDDPRIGPLIEGVDDARIKLDETLKILMLMDSKNDKDHKEIITGATDNYEKTLVAIDKILQESSE
jgi:hypothetical protein